MRQITFLQDFAVHEKGKTISIDSMTASNLVAREVAVYAVKEVPLIPITEPVVEATKELINEQKESAITTEEVAGQESINSETPESIADEQLPVIIAETTPAIPEEDVSKKQHLKKVKNK
jgi:hypothetical protein